MKAEATARLVTALEDLIDSPEFAEAASRHSLAFPETPRGETTLVSLSRVIDEMSLEDVVSALPWLLITLLQQPGHPHYNGCLFTLSAIVERAYMRDQNSTLVSAVYGFSRAQAPLHEALNWIVCDEIATDDCCENVLGFTMLKRLMCN